MTRPTDLSPQVWLDSSKGDSVVVSSGRVSEWRDQSGHGRHWSAPAAGNRPHSLPNGDGVHFLNAEGVDEGEDDLQYLSLSDGSILRSYPFTVWVVVSNVENSSHKGVFISGHQPSVRWNCVSTEYAQSRGGGSLIVDLQSSGAPIGTSTEAPQVIQARFLSDRIVTRVDSGDEREQVGSMGSIGGIVNFLGTDRPDNSTSLPSSGLRGAIHEVVIVDGDPSESDRDGLQASLQTKWATTTAGTLEPPTDEEVFQASFEDASGRDPLPTALLDRTPAKQLCNHLVNVYRYPPYIVTKRVPIELDDYDLVRPGNMIWHKDDDDPLFAMGRWAQVQGRRFTDSPLEVELTLRISDHPESFEAPT